VGVGGQGCLEVLEFVYFLEGRLVKFVELLLPIIIFLFFLVSFELQVLVGGLGSLPPDHMGVLVLPEDLFFFSFVIHLEVVLRSIPFLP
jgi:hypothetical protein